ncbi:hypothetical protein MPER_11701, partial [Moniliophthora perniciosa FA553]
MSVTPSSQPKHHAPPYLDDPTADDIRALYAGLDSHGHWFGPVSPMEFLDQFLPENPMAPRQPKFSRKKWSQIREGVTSKEELCNKFTELLAPYSPDLDLKFTSEAYDDINCTNQTGLIRVDISAFPKNVQLEQTFDVSQLETFLVFNFPDEDTGLSD